MFFLLLFKGNKNQKRNEYILRYLYFELKGGIPKITNFKNRNLKLL